MESDWVKKVLSRVLKEEKRSGELSVLFVGDEEMAELNARYRGEKRPTDVLAFPADVPQSPYPVLGDIVVSTPTATRQAKALGHPVKNEILFLLIHGVLHLLGFDHHAPKERKIMFRKQSLLFDEIIGHGKAR